MKTFVHLCDWSFNGYRLFFVRYKLRPKKQLTVQKATEAESALCEVWVKTEGEGFGLKTSEAVFSVR
jgi:hypothetical protein